MDIETPRDAIDERAEADALDNALDFNALSNGHPGLIIPGASRVALPGLLIPWGHGNRRGCGGCDGRPVMHHVVLHRDFNPAHTI